MEHLGGNWITKVQAFIKRSGTLKGTWRDDISSTAQGYSKKGAPEHQSESSYQGPNHPALPLWKPTLQSLRINVFN